jgi:hypothetical protein
MLQTETSPMIVGQLYGCEGLGIWATVDVHMDVLKPFSNATHTLTGMRSCTSTAHQGQRSSQWICRPPDADMRRLNCTSMKLQQHQQSSSGGGGGNGCSTNSTHNQLR